MKSDNFFTFILCKGELLTNSGYYVCIARNLCYINKFYTLSSGTPWSRTCFRKLIVTELVRKLHDGNGT
jgi:hypothetical protein